MLVKDRYYIYVTDNFSLPIDPDDSSTWVYRTAIFGTNDPIQYTVVATRPDTDGFLVNTPIKVAVALRDVSKGNIYSPLTEITPTMASEAYREMGDLRISNGFFKDGDNSTLYSFGKSNGSLPLRLEHKDIVNVGERVIFDGSWLRSDVFPQMNGTGYDSMSLSFYSPRISERSLLMEHFSSDPLPKVGDLKQTTPHQMEDVAQTMWKIVIGQWRFKQKMRWA